MLSMGRETGGWILLPPNAGFPPFKLLVKTFDLIRILQKVELLCFLERLNNEMGRRKGMIDPELCGDVQRLGTVLPP